MSTHRLHNQKDAIYFITFTCLEWWSLFEITQCHYAFDKWFEYLQSKCVSLLGYVIMPNHFHGLLYLPQECDKNLNQLVSNGKRFLAYEVVKLLEEHGEMEVLKKLSDAVSAQERSKGKKHEVFRPSFDAKECYDVRMVETKLNYIHFNPVRGKWRLVEDYVEYPYSSAAFYEMGASHKYLKHYRDFV